MLLTFYIVLYSFYYVTLAERMPSCGKSNLTDVYGTIESPHYPKPFDSQIHCEWLINSPKQTLLKLEILDLDLDKDCSQHWLSIPSEGGRGSNILCGRKFPLDPITVAQPLTTISYYSSEVKKVARGFALRYTIQDVKCNPWDVHCRNGGCVSNASRCDGVRDCEDGSDELGCPHTLWCAAGTLSCSTTPNLCYSFTEHTCDGVLFCPHGEDELGCSLSCPNEIACSSGDGCYDPSQRCNGIRNCRDNSDETDCPGRKMCAPLDFICRNSVCIPSASICDGIDDCGDRSDEHHCSKSNLVTAATLGLLTCACISCVGLILIYRFILTRSRHSSPFFDPLDIEQELPEVDTDDGFVFREPPPSYSASVLAEAHALPPLEASRPLPRRHRRRQRRPRVEYRPPAKHILMFPLPDVAHLQHPVSSSPSVSPSRESVTSSTSVEDLLLQ